MSEPDYYAGNGLSPIGAFKQGLMSEEEYIGFLKGNIIKYVVRAGKKDNAIKDLEKARNYIDLYAATFMGKSLDLKIPEPVITIDTEIDEEELVEKVKKAIEEGMDLGEVDVTPDIDTNILKITPPKRWFDENGKLKEEYNEIVKKYFL